MNDSLFFGTIVALFLVLTGHPFLAIFLMFLVV